MLIVTVTMIITDIVMMMMMMMMMIKYAVATNLASLAPPLLFVLLALTADSITSLNSSADMVRSKVFWPIAAIVVAL